MDVCAVPNLHADLIENGLKTTNLGGNDRNENDRRKRDLTASEERVNVDRRWLGTSVVRVRVLAAGLVLLGTGCAVLGWGSRSRQTVANAAAHFPPIAAQVTGVPGMIGPAQSLPGGVSHDAQARSLLAGLPLIFEPNQGQGNLDAADARAKFVTRGSGYSLFLGSDGAILSMVSGEPSKTTSNHESLTRVDSLQMKLAGANPNANVTGADLLPGKSNYFLGNDPAKWRRGVPQFARVRYEGIYPGINLVFYGNQGHLEYDFQVAPGSDPAQAELAFNGAKQLELKDGALVIQSGGGSVQLEAPHVYQEISGRQQSVEGRFVLRGANRAGFAIGAYDHSRELVIDPVLTFSTYFGGSGDERSTSVAVDGSFNVYITGSTTSTNLPTIAGVFQPAIFAGATQNVYIAKIQPPLGAIAAVLDYVTYLGGEGPDYPVGISVDGSGNAYVAGTTNSAHFPTTLTGYQNSPESPGTHAFVTELLSDASVLQYSSYLSGNGTDIASGMTIDASGNLYVTGTTTSTDASSATVQFPASNLPQGVPYQSISRAPGQPQFFVTKVNTFASKVPSIAYSTYFGGATFYTTTPTAVGGGIAVDTSGNVYFTGTTNYVYQGCSGCSSSDFPILNAYQPCLDSTPPTIVVNPPTCTYSTNPTETDAFAAKLNLNPSAAQGLQLVWSTYLGGSATDSGAGIALDTGAANVYVVGTTDSNPFVATSVTTVNTSAPYQLCLDNLEDTTTTPITCTAAPTGAPNDAFVARLTNPTTTTTGTPVNVSLNYFSYLGGSLNEAGFAIAVDSGEGAVITGWTQSPDLPVYPAATSSLTGAQDAFTARLNTTAVLGQTTGSWVNYFGGSSADTNTVFTEGTGVTLDVNQNAYFAGDTNSPTLQVQKQLVTTAATNPVTGYNGGYDSFVTQSTPAFTLSISGVLTVGTNQLYVDAGNQATFTYTVTNNGPDLASNVTILDNLSQSSTGVPLTLVSASVSSGTCGSGSTNASVSCSLPPLQAGSTATITIVVVPTPNSGGSQATFNGGSVQAIGPGNIVLAQTSVSATMSDFTIAVSPKNNSVAQAGDTAQYQVQLNPFPAYASSISLACSGLPTGATCNFTNQSVKLIGGPGSSTLNLVTTARPIVTPAAIWRARQFYAMWLAVPGLTLLGAGVAGDRRRRRILGLLMMCALFALLLLQPACGGTSTQAPVSGTPPGIYTITVTGTSGTDSKSGSITLSVP
jgi:uncharacterized repeat protein (TIGR01451 family)